jgi:hypothetical protein
MATFTWYSEKNETLQRERGMSFEELVAALEARGLLANLPHPNQQRYPHQQILVVNMNDYAYELPCIPTDDGFFLVTAFASRKATQRYLRGDQPV